MNQTSTDTQFTLLDATFDWRETTYLVRALGELGPQPAHWEHPVDFLHGELFGRLEVLAKPTDLEVEVMLCFWQDGSEICQRPGPRTVTFRSCGVYYLCHPAPGYGSDEKGNEDWIRCKGARFFSSAAPVDVIQCQWWARNQAGERKVLRERGKHWPRDEREDFGADVRPHLPIRQRLELIAVAADARFSPPEHWTGFRLEKEMIP